MSQYSFKQITSVHNGDEFINIMLSRTNRKTPTVIRRHFAITRIRKFYMMKVRFITKQFSERFDMILTEFPKIDLLHPFYAELFNTNYDKEHYKICLGQINTLKNKIERIGSDYVKLLKYGQSLYQCKTLKRSAMGRMVKCVKKADAVFVYLEEVRQHLSRLPTIDPEDRTLLLCGCPNAGKSSFMNLVTRAEVEVQPYAFTTKSLYVGHMDYKYSRWQVIDTPGILDRPVDEMNTIELQSVVALSHTKSSILFFVDVSEHCGMSIPNQLKTFQALLPIFQNQPKYLVCNKTDLMPLDKLAKEEPANMALLEELQEKGIPLIPVSTLTKKGVMELRNTACDRQLTMRVDQKLRNSKTESVLNRVYVANPKSDGKERPTYIPPKIAENWKEKKFVSKLTDKDPSVILEAQIEEEEGDDYVVDYCKNKDIAEEEHKYDKIPRFWNGKNITDFVTEDIEEKYEKLQAEEEDRQNCDFYAIPEWNETEQEKDFRVLGKKIRDQIAVNRINKGLDIGVRAVGVNRASRARVKDRSTTNLREKLESLGVSMENTENATFTKSKKRERSESIAPSGDQPLAKRQRTQHRSLSRPPRGEAGIKDDADREKLKKMAKKAMGKKQTKGQRHESDRHVFDLMPKHLYSGKRGIGSNQRR